MGKTWDGMAEDGGFSEEEDRRYNESMEQIRKGLEKGLGYDEACSALTVKDAELRSLIVDDFLKITIANDHFEQGLSLNDVAARLKIQTGRLEKARAEMIREVGEKAAEEFRRQAEAQAAEAGETEGPSGNA